MMKLNFQVKPSVRPIILILLLLVTSTFSVGEEAAKPAPAKQTPAPAKKAVAPAPVKKAPVPEPAKGSDIPLVTPGSNLNISFFIVEHTDATGNSHRFAADKVEASDGSNLQDFSMLISTIFPEREIGTIDGMFRIGDELWSFGVRSIVKIGYGRLIVNTKLSVKDGQKGSTELISKEPYRDVKIIGLREQNVTEFIDVGVKIEAQPKVQPTGLVQTAMKMSISEIMRENDRSRQTRVPIVSFRTVDTSMDFTPGQLEVLSELTIKKSLKFRSGIPYLRNIPYLGKWFFSHTNEEMVDTKLYIVGGVAAPQEVMLKEYEALKKRVEEEQIKLPKYK